MSTTLASLQSVNATATAHIQVPVVDEKLAVSGAADECTELPAEGLMLAETACYRSIDSKFKCHTNGVVVKEAVQLMLVPGGIYQLLVTPPGQTQQEVYELCGEDWELRPGNVEQIVPTAHTLKATGDSMAQVVLQGEFEGEDLPLHDIEIKWRGGLKNFLLHPNTPGPLHKRPAGQAKAVRLGFEQRQEAQEWWSLLSIALGQLDLDSPGLSSMPTALSASRKIKSLKLPAIKENRTH